MRPRKSKVEPSSCKNYCLRSKSKSKRFKGESLQSDMGSSNENVPSEVGDTGNSPISAAMSALDNHLILQEIFKYFSPGDLRICCEVNEKWRAIAGPMILEYHLDVDFSFSESHGIRVKISKGYIDPQIEERDFLPEGETEYLETLKRNNCFLSLEFRGDPEYDSPEHYQLIQTDHVFQVARDFIKKFKTRVYKLKCSCYVEISQFFRGPPTRDDLQRVPDFPNCEEYHEGLICTLLRCSDMKIPCPMTNLRRFYLGEYIRQYTRWNDFQTETPKVLQMIPNLQQMYGVPFTAISKMERSEKLHLVRSIRFHGVEDVSVELDTLKTMVQLGMKFKFLRIQRPVHDYYASRPSLMEELKDRTNPHFKDLLNIGKDTLEHLVINENNYGPLIDIPARMSALRHITLKTHGHNRLYFPKGFNFSEFFPKLTTISFQSMTVAQWKSGRKGSWWNSEGVPGWDEFRKGIKNLRCEGRLSGTVKKYLLRTFPSVSRIEFASIDGIYVDGIISD